MTPGPSPTLSCSLYVPHDTRQVSHCHTDRPEYQKLRAGRTLRVHQLQPLVFTGGNRFPGRDSDCQSNPANSGQRGVWSLGLMTPSPGLFPPPQALGTLWHGVPTTSGLLRHRDLVPAGLHGSGTPSAARQPPGQAELWKLLRAQDHRLEPGPRRGQGGAGVLVGGLSLSLRPWRRAAVSSPSFDVVEKRAL